jgi:hypothetical protein
MGNTCSDTAADPTLAFRRGLAATLRRLTRRISYTDLQILLALPATRVSGVAQAAGLSEGTCSPRLQGLMESGLVSATPAGTARGGTQYRYDLTPAGAALFLPRRTDNA